MKIRITQMFSVVFLLALMFGCAAQQPIDTPTQAPVKADVTITIKQDGEKAAIVASVDGEEKVLKSMEVNNPGLKLSQLSAISGETLFIKIFSGISVADVTRAWNDLIYLENETEIKDVNMFIDSGGGDAFSGLALADLIENYQKKGFKFTAIGMGIIASAAVPIFAVCDETRALTATVFMVHEAALWKWPGRESKSDIIAQGNLMYLLQRLYLEKLVNHSNLPLTEWEILEAKTSWFSVRKAAEWGILDYINDIPAEQWLKDNPPIPVKKMVQ